MPVHEKESKIILSGRPYPLTHCDFLNDFLDESIHYKQLFNLKLNPYLKALTISQRGSEILTSKGGAGHKMPTEWKVPQMLQL